VNVRNTPRVTPLASASGDALALDDYLPFRLSLASNAVSRLIARAYEDRFGLSIPQWRLMSVLAEAPATQASLLARTAMDKVTVSRAAQALVGRRLAARTPSPTDARSHRLALTPEGERLYADIAPLALAYEAALLAGLAPDEVRTLKRLLQRLEGAAAQLSGPGGR
jgi:DNA-binding MarR family transcriptional regulator